MESPDFPLLDKLVKSPLILVNNQPFLGGKFPVAPGTKNDDGKFNVAIFDESQMKDFVERMKLKTRLSDDSMTKVISMMTEKYSPTRWGLINSITEVAQDFTLERRVELEKIAGDLLLVA